MSTQVTSDGLIVREAQPFNAEAPLTALAQVPTPTPLFYVRCNFDIPTLDRDSWQMQIHGAVRRPLAVNWEMLQQQPRARALVLLECAGNGRRRMVPTPEGVAWDFGAAGVAVFEGVPLKYLLHQAGIAPGAIEVLFRGADAGSIKGGRVIHFERSLPLQDALADDVLIADTMNGAPLTPEHGYPVRLVVPRWYAVASVKWLTDIVLLEQPFEGHFQTEKYRYFDDPLAEQGSPVRELRVRSLITSHQDGDVVPCAPVLISGIAWSGAAPVTQVEVSVDGGATWQDAELKQHEWPGPSTFTFSWLPGAGDHSICCRARDAAGNVQPMTSVHNKLGYGNNVVQTIRLSAR